MTAIGAAPALKTIRIVEVVAKPTGSFGALAEIRGIEKLSCISDFLRDADARAFVHAKSLRCLNLVGVKISEATMLAVKLRVARLRCVDNEFGG